MNQLIRTLIEDFSLDEYRPIIPRDLDLGAPLTPRKGNLVKVVTGMRRSGKSYRLLQEIDALMASGVPLEQICYFNFEDERLAPVTPQTGDEVLETFYTLRPETLTTGAYLFFDELQEMEGWGLWLRRIVDTNKVSIYVTGSSSKMLSSEISTEFRGRALDFELLPYSFGEYLRARDVLGLGTYADTDPKSHATKSLIMRRLAFDDYLTTGGFPATLGLPRQQAVMLLQSYVQRVISRDVIDRHKLTRPQVVTTFSRRVLRTNAKPISIRKTESDLRSLGMKTSREYLADLLGYLEEAYLVFLVREFSYALSEDSTSQPKVYAIDPGLAFANARANSLESGQRLENAVYLELRRRNPGARLEDIASYHTKRHGWEVDFVVGDAAEQHPFQLIQVCANPDDTSTLQRELRSLWEALEEGGLSEGLLVVGDGNETIYEKDGKIVRQIPATEWLIGD